MIFKLRQKLEVHKLTYGNRVPNTRSRKFLLNYLRRARYIRTSAGIRGAMGFLQWILAQKYATENRIAHRASCFITGRSRGTSKRFTVARTLIKHLASAALLPGLKKSSY